MAIKKCPYCAEEIQFEAIKCRFCGESVECPEGKRKIALNEGQETSLWIGVGIADIVGAAVFYNRGGIDSSLDLLLFLILVAITTVALLYSLQDRPNRPKWQEPLIKFYKKHLQPAAPKQHNNQTNSAKQPEVTSVKKEQKDSDE